MREERAVTENTEEAEIMEMLPMCLTLRGILMQRCEKIKTENQMLKQRMLMVKVDL